MRREGIRGPPQRLDKWVKQSPKQEAKQEKKP
jgi:hypothetical protein